MRRETVVTHSYSEKGYFRQIFYNEEEQSINTVLVRADVR